MPASRPPKSPQHPQQALQVSCSAHGSGGPWLGCIPPALHCIGEPSLGASSLSDTPQQPLGPAIVHMPVPGPCHPGRLACKTSMLLCTTLGQCGAEDSAEVTKEISAWKGTPQQTSVITAAVTQEEAPRLMLRGEWRLAAKQIHTISGQSGSSRPARHLPRQGPLVSLSECAQQPSMLCWWEYDTVSVFVCPSAAEPRSALGEKPPRVMIRVRLR